MKENNEPKEKTPDLKEEKNVKPDISNNRTKQQQSDPNITELKGLIDSDEELEPKDTDNKV
ncbi:MAG TPA: hypothetical protein VM888_15610 [Chitinophagaceae bacterium]|nr:hypothetical protein [Chitinophagaceae bacterium]